MLSLLQQAALVLVNDCVRNTQLENLHAGVYPSSKTGDYSDVKVVSPYGEIPWNDMSRISDEEMKALMIEIVDRVFTAIQDNPDNPKVGLRLPSGWNAPEISEGMIYKGEMVTALQKYSQTEFVGFTDRMVQGSEVWD